MTTTTSATLRQWRQVSSLPLGAWIFSRLAGLKVPYAGTIRARIVEVDRGRALVRLRERRGVRNHLGSIHAVALVNLAEMTANLALMSLQPDGGRWIVTGIDANYGKKARGVVEASCQIQGDVDWSTASDLEGLCTVRDEAGDVVVELRPRWRIGPA